MKKFKRLIASLVCGVAACAAAFTLSACSDEEADYYIYMPDGAPALAMAQLLSEDMGFGYDVRYEVVNAGLIGTYVTGESPEADICILPVNQAATLLGSGETYKMLGTVTHGNLFILSKTGQEEITASNLSSLAGKSVGVINLSAVPGLTFKAILHDAGIGYEEVASSGSASQTAVNLYALSDGAEVGTTDYDYYVLPEPAATTLSNRMAALEFKGSLQELYGEQNGYPQAVMVAKSSLIEQNPEFVGDVIDAAEANAQWITAESTSMETVVNAVTSHLTEGMSATFTSANLNQQVIANCAINFVPSSQCRDEVLQFLDKIEAVSSQTFSVSDAFFYNYSA